MTAAAAIESGQYDKDSQVPGGATYQLPLTSGESGLIDNEGRDCGTGKIPFTQAMENSCNTTFAALANEVGADAMLEQAEAFGFNQHYLDDLRPQAESNFPDRHGRGGDRPVRHRPVRGAVHAAADGDGGGRDRQRRQRDEALPRRRGAVGGVRHAGADRGRGVSARRSPPPPPTTSPTCWSSTVDNGTASPAAIPGIDVAGKTGTAQSGIDNVPPYAWFVSFAPADNPEVAVAVMIEKADIPRGEVAGGLLGGPIAKAVMEAVIK